MGHSSAEGVCAVQFVMSQNLCCSGRDSSFLSPQDTFFPSGWSEGCIVDVIFMLIMCWDWRFILLADETLTAKPLVT